MSLFENFPYTNLHELNLDWLINAMNQMKESQVFSVNGLTGDVILYEENQVVLPEVPEEAWSLVRLCDGTQRGILFQNDNTAYIVHGGLMAQIYTTGNQPPYPVTRVNGQYGDITLYQDAAVQFPSLTGDDIHSWNIFRRVNNLFRGIEFDDDGKAYIIDSNNRYQIYTDNDTPPYPVSEVNGQTGDVVLFDDENGTVEFPTYTAVGATGWSIGREVNGTMCELILNTDGTLDLNVGGTTYTVYTSDNPQPNWVDDPEADVIEVSSPVELNTLWGFIRETAEGPVGLVVDNSALLAQPEAYIQYVDGNNVTQRIKLLTPADIPSGSGVVSINGQSGVVVLTGENIKIRTGNNTNLDTYIDNHDNDIKNSLAVYQSTNTATQNIAKGTFVFWNGAAYVANQAISSGQTLSATNLDVLSAGYTNELSSMLDTIASYIGTLRFVNIGTVNNEHTVTINMSDACRFFLWSSGTVSSRFFFRIYHRGINALNHADLLAPDGSIVFTESLNSIKLTCSASAAYNVYMLCYEGYDNISIVNS